jgi:hypothetical protein
MIYRIADLSWLKWSRTVLRRLWLFKFHYSYALILSHVPLDGPTTSCTVAIAGVWGLICLALFSFT